MISMMPKQSWKTLACFVDIRSPWLRLIGEKLADDQGNILDYWRVEKADSVIILPIHHQHLLLPTPVYRPGLGAVTLDFPGGRVLEGQTPIQAVPQILQRELGLVESAISSLSHLNTTGWAVNSSFSNQKLYGFVAEIDSTISLEVTPLEGRFPLNSLGIHQLLEQLTCLQCRALLLEWWYRIN